MDHYVFCPLSGRCPKCQQTAKKTFAINSSGTTKLVYGPKWPYTVQNVQLKCDRCDHYFLTTRQDYIDSLGIEDMENITFLM